MKNYIVLGAGLMGGVAAHNLLEVESEANVTLTDFDSARLDEIKKKLNNTRLTVTTLDITDRTKAVEIIGRHDVAVDCLPIHLAMEGMEAAIEACVPLTGLNGERPLEKYLLHERAEAADTLIIPGLGVAPGLSHVLVGRGVDLLDTTENAVIYVGGLPVQKRPPLNYKTVYSLKSVLYYYSETAHIILNGKETMVEPLSGLEAVHFDDPIGELEAFYTDGLTSLVFTMKDRVSGHLAEKTLRYQGHAEKLNFLRSIGLMDQEKVNINGVEVAPMDVLVNQLAPKLEMAEIPDMLVMRIIVEGKKDGVNKKHIFEVIDYESEETGFSAMARTTVFPCTVSARMIANEQIKDSGVKFPEQAVRGDLYEPFIEQLKSCGVIVNHREM